MHFPIRDASLIVVLSAALSVALAARDPQENQHPTHLTYPTHLTHLT